MTSLVLRLIDRCAWRSGLRAASPRLGERAGAERGYGRSSGRTRQTALPGAMAAPGGLGFNHRFSALYHAGPECVNGFPRTFPDTFPDRAATSHALPRRAKGTLSLTSEMTAPV